MKMRNLIIPKGIIFAYFLKFSNKIVVFAALVRYLDLIVTIQMQCYI